MLNDWIWSALLALGIWLEIAGWAAVLKRKLALASPTALALSLALLSQAYFALSLLGGRAPALHSALLAAGALAFLVTYHLKSPNLTFARWLSPLSWARAWPWLLLPLIWLLLRFVDALIPHGDALPLAINLHAPHRWFEDGVQQIDPLNPLGGAASLWEGLYFHVQALAHGLKTTHQTALVRAQITSQLLHFTAGQLFSIALMAKLFAPWLRLLGVGGGLPLAAAFCFGWLAAGLPALSSAATLARDEWGAVAFISAALCLVTERRYVLAFFLAGTALATDIAAVTAVPGLIAVTIWAVLRRDNNAREKRGPNPSTIYYSTLALLAGIGLWCYRNVTQTGQLVFPTSPGAGWIPQAALDRYWLDRAFSFEGYALTLFLTMGAIGLGATLWRLQRDGREPRWLLGLTIFALVQSLAAALLGYRPLGGVFFVAWLAIVGVAAALQHIATLAPAWFSNSLPYFWVLSGLVLVELPFHVVWQNLSYAFTPNNTYLELSLKHHAEKHWASLQLAPTERIAWESDSQFYYLAQPAAAISGSSVLKDTLAHAANPRERARIFCDLGFSALALEDHRHGPELTGLVSWLKVTDAPILYSSNDVTLYGLRCDKP